jgi:FkbM family methyltransferase
MGADSGLRRAAKRVLAPVLNERTYRLLQAAAKAWDIRRGSWSEPEIALIPRVVRAGEAVIDIGANFGLYCYHLSRAVGRAGRVYAFEPVGFTCDTARLVGRLLGCGRNVELVSKGCSDRTGRVAFTVPVQRSGAISAGQTHLAGRNDERPGKDVHAPHERSKELWCDVVALDEFLPPLRELSFIKSDIEGADLLALRGARRLIEQHSPTILCEISPWFLEGFGISAGGFADLLLSRGYEMYHYERAAGREWLRPAALARLGTYSSHNYVFVHPRRRQRLAALLEAPAAPAAPVGGAGEGLREAPGVLA